LANADTADPKETAEMDNVHRAVVQFALGDSSITLTINTYSYVMSGRGEVAARSIDDALGDAVTVNNVKGGEIMYHLGGRALWCGV
jgi:hypothetical protein